MKNEVLMNKIKKESVSILSIFIVALLIFKIAFFEESFSTILGTVWGLFWLIVLPGFAIMYLWHDKLGFIERLVAGIAVGASITGISSYYLGIFGLNISNHTIILPIIILLVSVILILRKK